jgi:hypothetical protein
MFLRVPSLLAWRMLVKGIVPFFCNPHFQPNFPQAVCTPVESGKSYQNQHSAMKICTPLILVAYVK